MAFGQNFCKEEMMKVYFGQPWGGLGDNLQFTTLPRLFSEKGVDFFVSQHNTYEILRYTNSVGK